MVHCSIPYPCSPLFFQNITCSWWPPSRSPLHATLKRQGGEVQLGLLPVLRQAPPLGAGPCGLPVPGRCGTRRRCAAARSSRWLLPGASGAVLPLASFWLEADAVAGARVSWICYEWRLVVLIEAQRAIYIEYMRHPKP